MDIARSEGMSISDQETQIECLLVFALGGESKVMMQQSPHTMQLASHLAKQWVKLWSILLKSSGRKGAPVLVRLIATVAERFGIQVTEKVLAQGIPVAGGNWCWH